MSSVPAATPLAGYRPLDGRHDEMVDGEGRLRDHWAQVGGALDLLGLRELRRRDSEIGRILDDDGVHYHVYDDALSPASRQRHGRRWRLDPVPIVISSDEWHTIERGIIQRAELLNAVLADLYGPQDLLRHGLVPPALVFGHPGYLRPLVGTRLPGPAQLVTAAFDLARDERGLPVVIGDRAQAPSGAGYALQDRNVISRVFPSLFRTAAVHRLAPFFRNYRSALQAAAPPGTRGMPRIVVLSPGPWNETAFEHAFLASELGFGLVEGSDLVVRDGRVHLRTLDDLVPVDVIVRRVDADYADPLELRPDSHLGVPGLVDVVRRGNVAVANPLGAGVLENPGLLAILPTLAEHVLGGPLRLASVPTWWCGDEDGLRHVLANLDALLLKPIGRQPGKSVIHGNRLDEDGRRAVEARIRAQPWAWVGQVEMVPATAPVLTRDGLEPRPTVLRTFVVAHGESYQAMPGGLTRSAARDRWEISSQAGSIAKDTWVVSSEPDASGSWWLQSGPAVDAIAPTASMSSRAAENLFWFGRYAERAEGTVRLLREVTRRRIELTGPSTAAQYACVDELLRALTRITVTFPGFDGDDAGIRRAEPDDELHDLITNAGRTGTLAHSVRHVSDAAQAVRDQLSIDTWTALHTLDREVSQAAASDEETQERRAMYGRMLQALLALQGLASEGMVRDPGWRFMDAGRRVERGLQLVALLRATTVDERELQTDSLLLESVLTVAESIVTYRRRYRSTGQLSTALDLLLLARDNPRSLLHQLLALASDLQALPAHPGDDRVSEAERPILRATTMLRLCDTTALAKATDGRRDDLATFLDDLAAHLRACAVALDDRHFTHLQPQRTLGGSR